jgi:hypothetical protein
MKDISMKKYLRTSTVIIISVLIDLCLSVSPRYKSTSGFRYIKYMSIKNLDIYKSEAQKFGYSSLKVATSSITADLIQSIKLVGNLQIKVMKSIWKKVNELTCERHSYFDEKQSFSSLASLRF